MSKSPPPFDHGLFLMHLHKGKEFFDHDQLEKAREELESANQIRPNDEKVLNMLGMTYYKLEMLPQAEEMYVLLAANNPEIYALQSNLGLIQLKLNKLEEARDSLNRALELQPANSKAHFYMGLLYEKKELWEEALYHFEQAKADKMVAKMQSRMNEQSDQSHLILPFEVIEVMESEQDLSAIVQQEMAQEPHVIQPEGEITGRMRAPDLAQAMFQIHSDELASTPESAEIPEETEIENEIGVQDGLSIDIGSPSTLEAPTNHEEDLTLDEESGADLMVQQLKEEIQEQSPWEKTHPSIFPEHFGEQDATGHSETNLLSGSTIDEPFLLSDEIAADISTFLAESRTDENPEEDVFYQEPILPDFAILNPVEPNNPEAEYPAEPDEDRIPTPEEVENEIAESPIMEAALFEPPGFMTAETDESLASDSEVQPPVEEPVEDLLEEIPQDREPEPPVSTQQEQIESEEVEVRFAVNENDDDGQIQEGFLQPSYLTPDFEERNLERTQDMDYTSMIHRDPPNVAEEIPEESKPTVVEQAVSITQPEAFFKQPSPAETEPERATSFEIQQETQDVVRPANLDQFSRDRLYIQPLVGSDRFLLIDPHLLEIIISEKLVCRTGTISSYTGNLQFTPWRTEQTKEKVPLIVVSGNGILFLADRRKEIFLISLNNEVIFVESNHLLVAQSSLTIEPHAFQDQVMDSSFSISRVSGRGTLALTCLTKPLTVNVHEGLPANIPAHAVIAWSGRVLAEVMDDTDLRKVMMGSNQESLFLRLRGTGDVVVEQGGLWGDRRTKRP